MVGDRLAAVLAVGVVGVHVRGHRARAVQRDERGDVLERRWAQRAQQRAHRPAFELEHADGVAARAAARRSSASSSGDVVDVGARRRWTRSTRSSVISMTSRLRRPEEVHLEEPEVLDAVHLVLRDDRRVLDRAARLRLALDRQVLGERLAGDHHRGGVDAVLAAQALEAPGDVDDALGVGIGLVERRGARRPSCSRPRNSVDLLEARVERRVAAHDQRRHELGDLVADERTGSRARARSRAPRPAP